jgi:hypothetical protein
MRCIPIVRATFPGLLIAVFCLYPAPSSAQASQSIRAVNASGNAPPQPAQVITLDPPTGLDLQADTVRSNGEALPPEPANFRRLGEATVGQPADLHTLTLRFSQTTRITGIAVSKDFKIEQGGSCVEGNVYAKGMTCRLLVRFTPQGPGNRLGKLTINHDGSATPDGFGLGGYSYMPVVSFIPSVITTVPGTYPSKTGLLSGAQNLTVDGEDVLYAADIGNNLVRKVDSSGAITNISPFFATPVSLAVDSFGEIWTANLSTDQYYFTELSPLGSQTAWGVTYVSATCTPSAPCALITDGMDKPAGIAIDSSNNLFIEDATIGALEMPVGGWAGGNGTLDYWHLNDTYAYFLGPPSTFAVNPVDDGLFTAFGYSFGQVCYIVQEPLYGAEGSSPSFARVAGSSTCGFSGDGGLGGSAEIGLAVGQMAFDAAGDLYFTDTDNQRVRRIEYNTGIIRTIAGNGIAGYTDDGSLATLAELSYPTGVGVDSQGQVYIISGTGSTSGGAQVIRKVTPTGRAYFGNILKGASASATVLVTNTGNSSETLTSATFTGPATADYSINPATTSCVLTPGSQIFAGQTCQIGFTFKPSALGSRDASYVLLNNTVNDSNTIQMLGGEVLPSASFKITSPTSGASFTSGTAVTFSVSVTSSSGPAPTGTVQFKVDGANFGSPVTISSGAASTSVTGLSTAAHTLSATYSGDANYAAGGPVSVGITVTAAIVLPRVTLAPMMQAANASCGQNSYEVIVSSGSGVPTGTVQLLSGNTLLASGQLNDGQAMLTTPQLASGLYSLVAHYSGDARDLPADSSILSQQITVQPGCGLRL